MAYCTELFDIAGSFSGSAERRLLEDLMLYYQKLERPVANESEAVELKFGLALQQIMDVVSGRAPIKIISYFKTTKNDFLLTIYII